MVGYCCQMQFYFLGFKFCIHYLSVTSSLFLWITFKKFDSDQKIGQKGWESFFYFSPILSFVWFRIDYALLGVIQLKNMMIVFWIIAFYYSSKLLINL